MARRIEITDPLMFRLLFEGFHRTAKPATPEEHRACGRILDQLDSISEPATDEAEEFGLVARRPLRARGGFMVLEDMDYKFLKKVIDAVQTPPTFSRKMVELQLLIEEAPSGHLKALVAESS